MSSRLEAGEELVCVQRHAPLCWGQRYIWLSHHQLPRWARHELNFSVTYKPPEGSTVASLRLSLDSLARRHEALRTTLHRAEARHPIQCAAVPAPVPVVCHETEHATRSVTDIITEFTTAPFELEETRPVRACVITTASMPRLLIVVWHHIAVDDWGRDPMAREFHTVHDAILSGRQVTLPPVRRHPVDLARYEASVEARRVHRRALAYQADILTHVPADVFGRRRRPGSDEAPAHSASLSSPAGLTALRALASRHKVWPAMIGAAAFTVLMAAMTGNSSIFFNTYARNREDGQHADLFTCMFQPVIANVDCAGDPTFGDLVARSAHGLGQALINSYCQYDEAMELVSRRSWERGIGIRVGGAFNYLQQGSQVRGGSRTLFNWNPAPITWSLLDSDVLLRIYEWQDCLLVTLSARSSVMSREDVERFLRGFERVLTQAADTGSLSRISEIAAVAGFRWPARADPALLIDNTPVSPRQVAECIDELATVRLARVFRREAPAGPDQLIAYVVTADPRLTAADLRTHVLGRMYDRDHIRCPDRFVVCARVPPRPEDPRSWDACAVLDEGSGRDARPLAPADESQCQLVKAVCEVNGLTGISLRDSYVMAGGRVMAIPRVMEELRSVGWQGLTVHDLASARPLERLAAMLVPLTPHVDP